MGAAAGGDRRHLPRVRAARDADLAAAGEADPDRPDVPLRPAPGGSLPAVLAVERRGDRRRRPGRRRGADRARACASTARPASATSRSSSTRSAIRRADPPTSPSCATYFGRHEDALPELERRAARDATRSVSSTRRSRRWPRSSPPRRGSSTASATPARPTSRRCGRTSTRSGSPTASSRRWCAASTTTPERPSSSTGAGREGQQQALGGGGRYDGLVQLLGGRPTPGIGFGLGLDRVVLALGGLGGAAPLPRRAPIAVVVGADPADTAGRLAVATRPAGAGLAVRADLSPRKLGRAAGGGGAGRRPLRGDPRRRARRRPRPAPGPRRGFAEAGAARRPRGAPASEVAPGLTIAATRPARSVDARSTIGRSWSRPVGPGGGHRPCRFRARFPPA